ncbi:glycosyltransferase [Flavobacterium sp. Fl-318]|uniref:Glycosyltransferase n=1 Tax=Flavobacterium cupriresistens TaxID=2893885 RepID=A0ABU4RBZ9_9FLAO|nr:MULTISPECIES: glycosyltransferase [unclassified Flavobacterium]MDX6190118.1 glycosyltransferase [Flavobacterium sp. Fl-318]UFH42939.1 glycosyltransferase [Flavobacterium sp. F-323]
MTTNFQGRDEVKMPLVTVILPCYNAELYVEEAVLSIMNQTYTNLEILVIDDCSNDDTNSILKRLSMEDSRIRLIRNEQNLRLVKTLNKGIDEARGMFIARMDADDVSLPERIEKQMDLMLSNPDVDLCGTSYSIIDGIGNKLKTEVKVPSTCEEIKTALLFTCPMGHPTVLFRKEKIQSLGSYDENMINIEDYELWLRVALKGKMVNLQNPLLKYRWHGENISILGRDVKRNSVNLAISKNSEYGFIEKYRELHLKMILAEWNYSINELRSFNLWKKELATHVDDLDAFVKVFDSYYSLTMLCVIKNKNSLKIKLFAFFNILRIKPIYTFQHFFNKI